MYRDRRVLGEENLNHWIVIYGRICTYQHLLQGEVSPESKQWRYEKEIGGLTISSNFVIPLPQCTIALQIVSARSKSNLSFVFHAYQLTMPRSLWAIQVSRGSSISDTARRTFLYKLCSLNPFLDLDLVLKTCLAHERFVQTRPCIIVTQWILAN